MANDTLINKLPCKPGCTCFDCEYKCKCCHAPKVVIEDICLWCQKDWRKVALYIFMPKFCKYFCSDVRFCKTCLKAIASEDDIIDWIRNEWDNGTYMTADGREMEDDEFIDAYYAEEFALMSENICDCVEWSEGYWDDSEDYYINTLNLADVQMIESIRTKKKEKQLQKELDKELSQ